MNARQRATRERLIAGIVKAVASSGYGHVSVADVIGASGASRSTFYAHFADIDACFMAALEDVSQTAQKLAEEAATRPGSPEPCKAVIGSLIRFALAEPFAARLLFCQSLAAGESARARRGVAIDGLARIIERRWGEGSSQAPGIDVPAPALVGGVFRLLALRLRPGVNTLPELLEDLNAWVNSYQLRRPPFRWRERSALETIERLAPAPAPLAPLRSRLEEASVGPDTGRRAHPRRALSGAEVARNHRERILLATAQACYEKGYHNVTVADIVSHAHISRNVFYAHFSDKRDATAETIRTSFEAAMQASAHAFFSAASWPQRLWDAGRALALHFFSHPELAYVTIVELHAIDSEVVRIAHERLMAFTLLFEDGYRQLPPDITLPHLTSEVLAATVVELEYNEAPRHGVAHVRDLRGERAYMCLAPFLGPAQATAFISEQAARVSAETR